MNRGGKEVEKLPGLVVVAHLGAVEPIGGELRHAHGLASAAGHGQESSLRKPCTHTTARYTT